MTFGGVCKISILAQSQRIFVAPLLFCWVIAFHYILEFSFSKVTALLIGVIISVYQQFADHEQDINDGFFEHCRFNGVNSFNYFFAKSISICISTLLPMIMVLLIFGISFFHAFLIFLQWAILSFCISYVLNVNPKTSPLNLLLAWLPLLTAPLIFLMDFFNNYNLNSLLILLGCDIITISAICIPFAIHKSSE